MYKKYAIYAKKSKKYLVISKKSSTFARFLRSSGSTPVLPFDNIK